MVAPYSLRAASRPRVATPITWDEVERAHAAPAGAALEYGPADVLRRLDRLGDLFEPVLTGSQRLPPG
jgi:bifunctional non-homologous end joining protein LigD